MGYFEQIRAEVQKQLSNRPSYAIATNPTPIHRARREELDRQIVEAIGQGHRLIFLLGPLGVGKSTQTQYFIQNHPEFSSIYKSFVKINNLDYAFLHLTSFKSRFFFISLCFLFTLGIIYLLPPIGALPFILTVAYFFAKDMANLIYIFHETFDHLFRAKPKIVLIDDLERSSLNAADRWALIANLWQYNTIYLISFGYPPDDNKARTALVEYAMKLKGRIIEMLPDEKTNFQLLQHLDGHLPFKLIPSKEDKQGWFALFTAREMHMLYNLATSRSQQEKSAALIDIQLKYIEICLEYLGGKLDRKNGELLFDREKREIQLYPLSPLLPDQTFYLTSFIRSIKPSLQVTFRVVRETLDSPSDLVSIDSR